MAIITTIDIWALFYSHVWVRRWACLYSAALILYAGLSSALHGIFVWGMVRDFEKGDKTAWILLVGLVIKLT
tara:strand:- start:40 stop:255 length:216 start_codon:yes stop_codon:yes gene_type:complete